MFVALLGYLNYVGVLVWVAGPPFVVVQVTPAARCVVMRLKMISKVFEDVRKRFHDPFTVCLQAPSTTQAQAVGRPGIVAAPAEAFEAAAEFLRDGRRKPGVHVFEAALPGVAAGGFVQGEEPLPAFAWRAGARIEEQVGFRSEAEQGGAEDSGVPFARGTRIF